MGQDSQGFWRLGPPAELSRHSFIDGGQNTAQTPTDLEDQERHAAAGNNHAGCSEVASRDGQVWKGSDSSAEGAGRHRTYD